MAKHVAAPSIRPLERYIPCGNEPEPGNAQRLSDKHGSLQDRWGGVVVVNHTSVSGGVFVTSVRDATATEPV